MTKMIKLLVLLAVIALPCALLAQETPAAPTAAPAPTPPAPAPVTGEKPYMANAEIWSWGNVKATFTHDGSEISVPGFTVKRVVTVEPMDTTLYYKENAYFYTWKEGYVVTAPTDAKDLGYFTYRPSKAPPAPVAATKGKIYKATPPATPPAAPTAPKTGWKRGEESVRSLK